MSRFPTEQSQKHRVSEPSLDESLDREYVRLIGPDAVAIIDRLRESRADTQGRAFMLRMDLIMAKLGAKWDQKSDRVWEHLQIGFTRRFEEPNWCLKINEDTWLAVIPTMGARGGALACIDIWNEISEFFVGDLAGFDAPLYEAICETIDTIRIKKIQINSYFDRDDPLPKPQARPRPIAANEPQSSSYGSPAERPKPAANRPVMVASVIQSGGRQLKVASAVEPLFEMKKMVMIGHRLEALVMENFDNALLDKKSLAAMDWNLRELVDITNIEQGLNLLRMRDPEQRKILMVIPAAFSTFASSRARNKITADVAKASMEMGLKVLFEVRGLDGVPPSRVLEIVSMIKPFCMTVVGQVSAHQKSISALTKCGLSGLCLEYDGVRRDDAALNEYLTTMSHASKQAAGACMIQGFDNYRQMAVARLSGVTHASIKATAMMTPKAMG